jgi:hypothetical protein
MPWVIAEGALLAYLVLDYRHVFSASLAHEYFVDIRFVGNGRRRTLGIHSLAVAASIVGR